MNVTMKRTGVTLGMAVLLLSGCGTKNPKPDLDLRQERSTAFHERMGADAAMEPIHGELTLPLAIARAIKYNLDHRVKLMESAVAREQLTLARMSYLPTVVASAGYSSRSNEAGAVSRSLLTGDISLEYSTSQEKDHTLSTLRASWDMIDFGLTYFTVSQKTEEIGIAEEQRRKVVQNIIQDVQEAYWRAYIAQELLAEVDALAAESEKALVHFKGLAHKGKVDPKEGLNQQRELLQIRYNMRGLQEQLAQGLGRHGVYKAETELAEARHQALSMAVLAQVHLAVNRYGIALKKYEDASELEEVSGNLAAMLQRDKKREGTAGYGRIRAKLQATATKMESMLAYAEVQNALMRVYNSLGVDPMEEMTDEAGVAELAGRIERHLQKVNESLVQ